MSSTPAQATQAASTWTQTRTAGGKATQLDASQVGGSPQARSLCPWCPLAGGQTTSICLCVHPPKENQGWVGLGEAALLITS